MNNNTKNYFTTVKKFIDNLTDEEFLQFVEEEITEKPMCMNCGAKTLYMRSSCNLCKND